MIPPTRYLVTHRSSFSSIMNVKGCEPMETPYPNMQDNPNLPVESGDHQPIWQALIKKMPPLTDLRVLVIHCGDGWFCRYALNHGATAVLQMTPIPKPFKMRVQLRVLIGSDTESCPIGG